MIWLKVFKVMFVTGSAAGIISLLPFELGAIGGVVIGAGIREVLNQLLGN
jgi:hypothetical protein